MKKRSGGTVMLKLIGLVKPLTGYMVLAVLLGLAGHLCAAFVTILGGMGILTALQLRSGSLVLIFVLCAVCAVLRGCLRYGEQTCNHYIAFRLLALLREKVFYALRRLAPAKLDGRDKGDLINLITSDIELLEVFYAHTISPVCIAVLMTVIMTLFIGSFHWLLGLVALAAYVVIGVAVPLTISKKCGQVGDILRGKSGQLAAYVLDGLRGLEQTMQYAAGEQQVAEITRRTEELSDEQAGLSRMTGLNSGVSNGLILIFDLLMLLCAVLLYQAGAVSFAGLLLPVIALMSSFGPVAALAGLGTTLQNTFAAGNRVLDILEEEPAVEETAGQPATAEFSGAAVENLQFSYGGETVLDGLSMDFPAGKIVGIVGPSGCGKSTLLKLLMRFRDRQGGSVTISGRDIKSVNTADLRALESYMTQETILFHDTIAANLRVAKADATQEELEAACRKASIHDFIASLPEGYETQVGELGDTLSGGERQRLGLARAFLHDAPFLLLDEPTSNLDSLNEAVILRALHADRENRTVVLVSHRRSTMGIADEVHAVENGRIS